MLKRREATANRLGIRAECIPRHIAIIMDGNGRWAEHQGLPRYHGHREGAKTVERIAQHGVDLGLECLTLYSFSMENWKRPQKEVDMLMYLYTRYLVEIRDILMRNEVQLVHLGRREKLPEELLNELDNTLELTSKNTGMKLAIALNYGSRAEIIDAAKSLAKRYKQGEIAIDDIDVDLFSDSLYSRGLPDPDLLIRTAKEMRISNFLLWQISYSEFYVTEKFWPDFQNEDLEEAIVTFSMRERRFGDVQSKTP